MAISVIIPVRDGAAFLAGAIESACAQPEVGEVIVVDDGSTDGSAAIARGASDPRVQLLERPAAGVGAARNAGARAATGDWLLFLDADDRLVDGALRPMLDAARPGIHVLAGRARQREVDGTVRGTTATPRCSGRVIHPFLAGTFLVRRSRFLEVGGYDDALGYAENTELGIRLAGAGAGAGDGVPGVDVVVLEQHLSAAGERTDRYAERVVEATQRLLDVHRDTLDRAGITALYAAVGAVAAARSGRWPEARQLLRIGLASPTRRSSDLARLVLTYVPVVRQRVWSPVSRLDDPTQATSRPVDRPSNDQPSGMPVGHDEAERP